MATQATRPTTREARRERSREIYKAGKSKGPYRLSRSVNESLSKSSTEGESSEVGTNLDGMCRKYHPVLSRCVDTFKSMKKQGSSLKMVKRINPVPRRADMDHYRDVKAQNEWLRSNVFGKFSLLCQMYTCSFWYFQAASYLTA